MVSDEVIQFGKKGFRLGVFFSLGRKGRGGDGFFFLRISDKNIEMYAPISVTIRVADIIFIKFRLLHR